MVDYKELAERLQAPGPGTIAFYEACDEAAAILRSLDAQEPFGHVGVSVDVDGDSYKRVAIAEGKQWPKHGTAVYAAPVAAQPPFAKDSWQHAVDDQLVSFGRTSQEFGSPHAAVRWLIEQEVQAAQPPSSNMILAWTQTV